MLLEWFALLILHGGLALLFLIVFLEGNPLVGSFIPGQILVIFFSFLVGARDLFPLPLLFAIVFIGSFLGDIVGYILGRWWGEKFANFFGLDPKKGVYSSSKRFFKRFGPWSLILGREFNLTRAFMPFLAGSCKMNAGIFYLFAFLSCLLWTGLSVFLGYYFGFVVVEKLEFIFELITLLIIYLVILLIVYRLYRRFEQEHSYVLYELGYRSIVTFAILFILILCFLSLASLGYISSFNEYFSFLFFPKLQTNLGFLLEDQFLGFLALLIFGISIFYKQYRLLISFFWAFVLSTLWTIVFILFLKHWFSVILYASILFFNILLFFLFILARLELKAKLWRQGAYILLLLLLFSALLVKFSMTQNFYGILFSYIVSVFFSEIFIFLSHYRILDKNIVQSMYSAPQKFLTSRTPHSKRTE
ncbi:DedA family protein [Candidatus Woesearchaeota archaeon]|nr:DedA family protein [Nanoarchaeota archaeon]MCB9370162.1 DedA family protein [Candidatus Woesearchaeota archaeon]USN44692.1 MAG: DedA family protein [Candidatus Woesearchaeota archaeon]